MWLGFRDAPKLSMPLRRPCSQLGHQMPPLIKKLPIGLWRQRPEPPSRNPGAVEAVSTSPCLLRQAGQDSCDDGHRLVLSLKPSELGMMTVASGRPLENLLGEQCLPPGGNQTLRVEVT